MLAKAKISALVFLLCACAKSSDFILVLPSDDVQSVVDAAAKQSPKPKLVFTPGRYFPKKIGQALIALNQKHDGLVLEAQGNVTLSAENAALSDPKEYSHPAVVSHVIYLGDGLTRKTKITGFKLQGARGFLTKAGEFEAEPNRKLKRRFIFYADGGGIKIFGNSSPTLENLTIEKNHAVYCGGAISIEQMGMAQEPALIRNVRIYENAATLTGAAIDLLPGSHAILENSHVAFNRANDPWITQQKAVELRKRMQQEAPISADISLFSNSSAITVFRGSSLKVSDSLINKNSGGIDYNQHVEWYWGSKSPVPDRKSEINRSQFLNNYIHQIKKGHKHFIIKNEQN